MIKPETAITMRRMMEHVVLTGTGKARALDGYTAGGKTGSAQIFDTAAHMYTHQVQCVVHGIRSREQSGYRCRCYAERRQAIWRRCGRPGLS